MTQSSAEEALAVTQKNEGNNFFFAMLAINLGNLTQNDCGL